MALVESLLDYGDTTTYTSSEYPQGQVDMCAWPETKWMCQLRKPARRRKDKGSWAATAQYHKELSNARWQALNGLPRVLTIRPEVGLPARAGAPRAILPRAATCRHEQRQGRHARGLPLQRSVRQLGAA